MLAVRLPENIETRLSTLAEKTGRSKSHYVRQAVQEFLESQEDYLLAVARLEKKNPRISLEELEKQLDIQK